MTLKFENPRDIYDKVNHELTLLIASLMSITSDEELNKAQDDARDKLIGLQVNLKHKLEELQKNSEWNTFTIAFYGETNAGKSTLIETLRILLNEPTKQKSRDSFKQLKRAYDEHVALLPKLEAELSAVDIELKKCEQQLEDLAKTFSHQESKLTQEFEVKISTLKVEEQALVNFSQSKQQELLSLRQTINHLQTTIIEIKAKSSLWQKFILIFKKLPEELAFLKSIEELPEAESQLTRYTQKLVEHQGVIAESVELNNLQRVNLKNQFELSCRSIDREKDLVEQTKQIIVQRFNSVSKDLKDRLLELEQCSDGEIIGDGRADYTRKTQSYSFNVEQQRFNILDVPGIEGKEGLVLEEIEKAVQSAHAVFYVTNKASPPQTGDNERKGTLEKIKEHLGAQTEVWSIFNKKITNPKYTLNTEKLLSDDEQLSLNEMDCKMVEQLGKHYQGSIPLTALTAFIASTDCFSPSSQDEKRRSKFLEDFSEEELLEKSRLSVFIDMLKNRILLSSNDKIKKANFNKVKESLDVSTRSLDEIITVYATIAGDIEGNSDSARRQLQTSFRVLNSQLQSKGHGLIQTVVQDARKHIYGEIDRDISNADFKSMLEKRIKYCVDDVVRQLPENVERAIAEFESSVDDILQRFCELSQEFLSAAVRLADVKLHTQINIKVELDNGIDKTALFGGLIAAAMVPFTAGASLWFAGAAAFSAIVALGKAAWGFFSTDFKKSEQKKSADINLKAIEDELKTHLQKSLAEASKGMVKSIAELDISLQSPVKQMENTTGLLDRSNQRLKLISKQIEKIGEL